MKTTRSASGSFTAIFDDEPCSFGCVRGLWTRAEVGGSILKAGNLFGWAFLCNSTITSGKLMEEWARPRLKATSLASLEVKVILFCFGNAF